MANGKNSIDVDKFDYIARDTQSCGLKSSFDHARLMCHSRVIDNEICFHAKEALNLYVAYHKKSQSNITSQSNTGTISSTRDTRFSNKSTRIVLERVLSTWSQTHLWKPTLHGIVSSPSPRWILNRIKVLRMVC